VQANQNELPEIGFVRERQVLRVFPVGRSTWWNGVRDGKYPQPVKLSDRITAWRVSDIRALIEATSGQGDRDGNHQT
jgi:predicted DNA-binding transcriptional regulator AlpA